jgi:hypothetical protein
MTIDCCLLASGCPNKALQPTCALDIPSFASMLPGAASPLLFPVSGFRKAPSASPHAAEGQSLGRPALSSRRHPASRIVGKLWKIEFRP